MSCLLCVLEKISQSISNPDIVLVIGPNPQMVWRTFQLQRHTAFVLFSSCTVLPLTWHGYRGHSLRLAQCIHLHMLKGFVGSRLEVPGIRGHTAFLYAHICLDFAYSLSKAHMDSNHFARPLAFTVRFEILMVGRCCEQWSRNLDQQATTSAASPCAQNHY